MFSELYMKKLLLFLLLINFFSIKVKGQSMLTNRQVYDFNINDEFQYGSYNNFPLKNIDRIKIIGKHFSLNNDTVFYTVHHDGYYTTMNYSPWPPHIEYTFWVNNELEFYTNLDSLISQSYNNWPIDSCNSFHDTLYYASQFCGTKVYEYSRCVNCCFEGQGFNDIFGEGLGLVYHHYLLPAQGEEEENTMIYYKKDTIVCGTPDNTTVETVSIIEYGKTKENIVLYPNPATNKLNLANITHLTTISIYDMFGKLVMETITECNTTLDINKLTHGVYTLVAEDEAIRSCYKVIITKE